MLVHGVEWKAPDFKLTSTIAKNLELSGVLLQIIPKVLLINEIHSHFKCAIQDIGTLEMDECLKELCIDGILKPEHQHLKAKGLTRIPHMPQNFKVKWMRFILSHVHNDQL